MRWKILSTEQKSTRVKEQKIEEIITILLENRGFSTKKEQEAFLKPTLTELEQDFFDNNELNKALSRIKTAVEKKERIIVYSDYDVDGVTGGAILWETLDQLGALVLPYIPNRMTEGYGMSEKGIDAILSQYPDTKLIITVDHGITAIHQTEYAKEKGLDAIITDHHTVGQKLPQADAVIHTTKLAASGVSYVFSKEINKYVRHPEFISGSNSRKMLKPASQRGEQVQHEVIDEHLALAAVGTIADLVPLVGPNRVIAKHGLIALNKTKRIGLLSLIEEAGLLGKPIGTYEVGFALAPRINASGRLTHALDALRLLCTKNPKRARELAQLLNSTNLERQALMTQTSDHARTLVARDQKLLFIAHESYHEGVIGLVAGKLVETYYRPAIVVSKGQILSKASARSIHGFNIVEAIRNCSDILVNVGGHPMAAGFTVETEKLSTLEERLLRHVGETLGDTLLEKELKIDIEIPFGAITKKLYSSIQEFSPFGMGNPEPIFMTKNVELLDAVQMGSVGQHLKLVLKSDKSIVNAIGFGKGDWYGRLSPDEKINIAFTISINKWNGREELQLKVKDIGLSS